MVVLGAAEVADVGVESAVDRQVVQRDLAEVALADEMRGEAGGLHLVGDQIHFERQVVRAHGGLLPGDVHGKAPREQRAARRATVAVDVPDI